MLLARLRTIVALAAAKARGQALGNPKLAEARAIANANHTAGADAFADSVAPAIREAQAAGAKTLREIAAALNGRGIGTARGGKWASAGGRECASADRVTASGRSTARLLQDFRPLPKLRRELSKSVSKIARVQLRFYVIKR